VNSATKVEFHSQARYDLWLASKPDFSRITDFRAYNLPLVTALPDMPAVTDFVADKRIKALRVKS
jgi:hypothetical protein